MLNVDSITAVAAATEISTDTWKEMRDYAVNTCGNDSRVFTDDLNFMEDEYREKFFSDVPEAKTKSGKWKKSYLDKSTGERVDIVPKAWQTSRSVIVNAIELGVYINGKGQTAIQKEITSTKKIIKLNTEGSFVNDIVNSLTRVGNKYHKLKQNLSDEEITQIRAQAMAIFEI